MSIAEKERNNNSIDMAITLTVDELAAESGEDASKVLSDFMMSGTAHLLYDEESKLWWDGPSAIAQMYREEIGNGGTAVVPNPGS